MLEIGLGVDSEVSGYDNIRIRGLILGLSTGEIEERMEDIAEFSELGDYLDIPVRTYSAGMLTRLMFSIATCFTPEILLLDEWIMAGDASFRSRAQRRLETFIEKTSVVVLASHNRDVCRRWCSNGVWLEKGAIVGRGTVEEVLDAYEESIGAQGT
jgi:ABC-2 type transport system ATP-binding protein/lipopolysaccharide transport system ATP-binding protein